MPVDVKNMLLTGHLPLVQPAKCCSVACKHLKIMQANNAAAECRMLNATVHKYIFIHFVKTANVAAGAIRLYSIWLLGRILEFFEIDLWLAPNLLMFGLARKDCEGQTL
jgi:hypothetical protein